MFFVDLGCGNTRHHGLGRSKSDHRWWYAGKPCRTVGPNERRLATRMVGCWRVGPPPQQTGYQVQHTFQREQRPELIFSSRIVLPTACFASSGWMDTLGSRVGDTPVLSCCNEGSPSSVGCPGRETSVEHVPASVDWTPQWKYQSVGNLFDCSWNLRCDACLVDAVVHYGWDCGQADKCPCEACDDEKQSATFYQWGSIAWLQTTCWRNRFVSTSNCTSQESHQGFSGPTRAPHRPNGSPMGTAPHLRQTGRRCA